MIARITLGLIFASAFQVPMVRPAYVVMSTKSTNAQPDCAILYPQILQAPGVSAGFDQRSKAAGGCRFWINEQRHALPG
jgi:hypothetical protein